MLQVTQIRFLLRLDDVWTLTSRLDHVYMPNCTELLGWLVICINKQLNWFTEHFLLVTNLCSTCIDTVAPVQWFLHLHNNWKIPSLILGGSKKSTLLGHMWRYLLWWQLVTKRGAEKSFFCYLFIFIFWYTHSSFSPHALGLKPLWLYLPSHSCCDSLFIISIIKRVKLQLFWQWVFCVSLWMISRVWNITCVSVPQSEP